MADYRGPFFRRMALWGATACPDWFVRSAPIFIGLVFFLILRRVRTIVGKNVRRIAPDLGFFRRLLKVALTFVRFAQCLTEGLGVGRATARARAPIVEHRERIEPLFATEKGLILLTAHVGPWDAVAVRLGDELPRPILVVMAAEADARAQGVQDGARETDRIRILRLGDDPFGALGIVEHLNRGGIVAIQFDRVPGGRPALNTRLFGGEFRVPAGPFRLAGMASVPLVPVFASREGFFRHRVEVGEPVEVPSGARGRALEASAQKAADQLEAFIRKHPSQWFHFVDDAVPSVPAG